MVKKGLLLLSLIFLSCKSARVDENGFYKPTSSSFKLKNLITDNVPRELDTINLYQYLGYYYNGNIVTDSTNVDGNKVFMKFCPQGRVYMFATSKLESDNLNPQKSNRGYYMFDVASNRLKDEFYTSGNGGQYVISEYLISRNGDTLISLSDEKPRSLYLRKKIPIQWRKYKIDW